MTLSLSQFIVGIFRLAAWFILLALVFIPLERLFPTVRQPILRRRWFEDLGFYFLNGLLPPLLILIPISFLGVLLSRIVDNDFYAAIAALPLPLRIIGALIIGEVGAYWGHRWSHENPWLWRIHSVHHSAENLDWLVNSRAHPLDFVITRTSGLVPVYLLGFAQSSAAVLDSVSVVYMVTGTFWSFLVHANIRWRFGFLEHVVASPAFHHWHHANDDPRHINHNFAAIFPWVDKLFGTLLLPSQRWPDSYGLSTPILPSPILKATESDHR